MKTLTDARIWVLRDLTAASLRKRAAHLKAGDVVFNNASITPAGVRRVKREMERLASQLEARAAKLAAKGESVNFDVRGDSPL